MAAPTVHFTLTEAPPAYPSAESVLEDNGPSPLAREIADRIRGNGPEPEGPSGEQVLRTKGVVGPEDPPAPGPAPAPEPEPIPIVEEPGAPPVTVETPEPATAASDLPIGLVPESREAILAGLEQGLADHAPLVRAAADVAAAAAEVVETTDAVLAAEAELAAAVAEAEVLARKPQEPIEIDPANPGRFRAVLVVEEERTADDRIIAKNATKWRTPPLPLMLMTKNDLGHDGSEIAAVIEKIKRQGAQVIADGRFDTGVAGLEAARLVANRVLTAVSLDGGDAERELIVEEEDEDGFPTKVLERMTALTILGATIVPFPAFGSTFIEWIAPGTEAAADDETFEECIECIDVDVVTAGAPISFPAGMFSDPALDVPTPIRVTPDGHVYGHAALWGTCHTSFPGTCLTPPRSRTGYAHFLLKSLPLQEGGFQPVGAITLDGPHASDRLGAIETQAHYDHTGSVAAYVNVGEDDHGIWVSGVLKPGITDEMATNLCGSNLSGDWRKIGGNLELVACLGVPVPGFPVAYTKGEEQLSLVAAGFGPQKRTKSILNAQVEAVESKANRRFKKMEGEVTELREMIDRLTAQTAPLIRESLARRFAD